MSAATITRAVHAAQRAMIDHIADDTLREALEAALGRMVMVEAGTDRNLPLFGSPVSGWTRSFAWWPRDTFDAGMVWGCAVWKRRIAKHTYLDGGPDFWWQWCRYSPPALTARARGAR